MNTALISPSGSLAPIPSVVDFRITPGAVLGFMGDSLTQGWNNGTGLSDATFRWQAPLESTLTTAFTGAGKTIPTYVNRGVGGSTTTDILARVATDFAAQVDHAFVLIGVNDFFNHSGTPIPPATSASNITAYITAAQARSPGCRFHILQNIWTATEHTPLGANTNDTDVSATNAAMKAAVLAMATPFVAWHDIQTPIFTIDEPAQNPNNLASGQLVQSLGGFHPTKVVGAAPATITGQQAISNRVFAFLALNLS